MSVYAGKTVFIVGGSSGIGLSTAKLFASKGAHVIIFSRTPQKLERASAEIKNCTVSDRQVIDYLILDVSVFGETSSVMKSAVTRFNPPDILVNSAGRAIPGKFEKITYQQFDETIKINLYGVWNVIASLVDSLKQTKGKIVNISSIAGFIGVYGYTDYSASKFGVIGFSEALRSELKPYGVDVFVLCPPDTDTPGFAAENTTKPQETRAISGNVKIMSPDKVAECLVRGIEKKKFVIIPGIDGKLTVLVKRFTPGLVNMIMDRTINKHNR